MLVRLTILLFCFSIFSLYAEDNETAAPADSLAKEIKTNLKISKIIVKDLTPYASKKIADLDSLPKLKRISEESVIKQLGIQEGDDLSSVSLSKAIKGLFQSQQYADVKCYARESTDGIILYVLLDELPRINKISIQGNDEFKEKEILDAMDLSEGDAASNHAFMRNTRKIKDLYRKEGILDIKVEVETQPIAKNIHEVEAIFKIKEGKKVRIQAINFTGNKSFADKKIRKQMDTKQRWKFLFIPFRTGKYEEDQFKGDLEKIKYFYKENGFFDIKIDGKPKFTYNAKGDRMFINIKLREGSKYYFADTEFKGNRIFKTDTLKTFIKYKKGELFNQKKLDESIRNIQDFYLENGYLYHNINNELAKSKKGVNILLNVTEGQVARIRLIKIEGNTSTREYVIRRNVKTYPGEIFRKSKLMRSFREIAMLNYFANIKPYYLPANSEGDVDLVFQVEEKPTGQFNIGMGYGVDVGLTGFLSIGIPNLLGRGQDLSTKLEVGKRVLNVSISYTEPWFMGSETSVGGDLYRMLYRGYYFDRLLTGGAIRIGRPFFDFDYTRIYWRYKLEDKEISNVDTTSAYAEMADEKWPQRTSSIKSTLVRDSRDLPFFPMAGSVNRVSGEWVGNFMGGDVEFQKYTLETSWYKNLVWKLTAMASGRSAVVMGYENSDNVPLDEYFRLGGTGFTGVRGYPDNSIGDIRKGDIIGGRSMLVETFELQLRVASPIGLIAFLDAGNSWKTIKGMRPFYMKIGTGIGVRIEIPMLGMLGFDLGYGFCDIYQNGKWEKSGLQPHFQFGSSF
ncbi:MAG: outer membrane protein assembly factor BamA [Candidatus Coatesbacteria bacterium]|nr:outer membrane protein assembly factor BamA [Candidatus Coatesbacteria bacterium]